MLSIVVPCFNEEQVLEAFNDELHARLAELRQPYEVVFVDDGSLDGTLSLLRTFAARDPHVRYLSFSRNFGKEAGLLAGLRESTGDHVAIMDADLQHPLPAQADARPPARGLRPSRRSPFPGP